MLLIVYEVREVRGLGNRFYYTNCMILSIIVHANQVLILPEVLLYRADTYNTCCVPVWLLAIYLKGGLLLYSRNILFVGLSVHDGFKIWCMI